MTDCEETPDPPPPPPPRAFTYQWNDDTAHAVYHQRAFQRLDVLRQRGELCDVALVPTDEDGAEHEEISAHRNVLAVSSPYFDAMFDAQTGMQETSSRRVHIQMRCEIVEAVVGFFYTGLLSIGEDLIWDLVDAATYFNMNELRQQCGQFVTSSLSLANCYETICLADKYGLCELDTAAWQYAFDNFRELSTSHALLDFSVDALRRLISADELQVLREETVYEAVIAWVRADPDDRKQHLPSLLAEVRFPLMRSKYLLGTVSEEPLIDEDPQCVKLLCNAFKHCMAGRVAPGEAGRYACASWEKSRPAGEWKRQNKWTEMGGMGGMRKHHASVSVGGRIFVAGGVADSDTPLNTLHCLDTNKMSAGWSALPSLPVELYSFGLCASDTTLYAVGGVHSGMYLEQLRLYDLSRGEWQSGPDMIDERADGAALLDGIVYAAGGVHQCRKSASAEFYDTRTAHWQSLPSMCERRARPPMAAVDGRVYVVGDGWGDVATVEYYDTRAGRWCAEPATANVSLTDGRCVVSRQGEIVMVGGRARNTWTFTNECKVLRDSAWVNLPAAPSLSHSAACAVDETIFVLGGYFEKDSACDSVHCLSFD